MNSDYSEDQLIEQPAIKLFQVLGWETANCFDEVFAAAGGTLGRETSNDVVLIPKLKEALKALNPDASSEALVLAAEELTKDRSTLNPVVANQEIYQQLKDGVKVYTLDSKGEEISETIKVVDWNNPENNDFFLASQFWVTGDLYKRRADLVGFLNGIPLIFIELKASHVRLENAFQQNFRDYKSTIPQLFWFNGFVILSNGSNSRVGTITAEWEHFAEWKKINSEGEEGVISLDTIIRGTCEKTRLLDLLENFILYVQSKGGMAKFVAKNHQFLGVNSAVSAVKHMESNKGKLGVFWHTQGSGKSYSMVFFSQKVLRKLLGNYTFLIVTDRIDLDQQIYKNFADAGAVSEKEVQARSGEHLKQLLTEDHRHIFTLIQKFHTEKGEVYPALSERSDIIVITDEAHRSQYDTLAMNMRNALPNASFIAFTGTPLIIGEEKTRNVFGDYVSIYNFRQSVEDNATVPLYYENRIPELQLTNEDLNEELQQLIEETELDEEQEKKLEREFARQYHLITREDRLEKVAQDIVSHFMERGHMGKAMVISVDKATAVRMYDKVKKYWSEYIVKLERQVAEAEGEELEHLKAKINFMENTDMAVVVSQTQNEIEDLAKKGVDIEPHRKRIVTEDLDTKFKDSDNLLRIVFVCAMWMTGFDVPSCSTIYMDKPMRNHTLMQAIARANRVYRDKNNGLIVDYVGVFRSLEKALAIYGSGSGGGVRPGDSPVEDKAELVQALKESIEEIKNYCHELGINLNKIITVEGFDKVALIDEARDVILDSEDNKKQFLFYAGNVFRLYKAILPDQSAKEFLPVRDVLYVIVKKIRETLPPADISELSQAIEELLDRSIEAEGYVISAPVGEESEEFRIDLSKIDFEALRKKFFKGKKRTETERLKSAIKTKLKRMVEMNPARIDFYEKFQALIDEYNSGALNIEQFFDELIRFSQQLNEEDKRAISENLSEEELAIFDLLTRPKIELTNKEQMEVKKVARELLETLKKEKLVLDWRKKQQARAAVKICIEAILDKLPEKYSKTIFNEKVDRIYHHVYDNYFGSDKSIYTAA
jgi:type I restriction enzyme R subunit